MEARECVRGEGDQIKFVGSRFERGQVVGLSELCWERALWPIKSPNNGSKRMCKRRGRSDQVCWI